MANLGFFGNITSFSEHARAYLFSLPASVGTIGIVETHKYESRISCDFAREGFKVACNDPELTGRSECGTHGGECVAVKNHLFADPVDPEVDDDDVS